MKCRSFDFLVKAARVTWEQGERDKQAVLEFLAKPANKGLLISRPDWATDGEDYVDELFQRAQTG